VNDQNLTTEEIDILKAYARGGMLKPIIPPALRPSSGRVFTEI